MMSGGRDCATTEGSERTDSISKRLDVAMTTASLGVVALALIFSSDNGTSSQTLDAVFRNPKNQTTPSSHKKHRFRVF
jgi:hypothetical protein